jgi:hypothetical protein
MTPPSGIRFNEIQRFRQVWALVLVGAIAALSWYAFIQQVLLGIPFGNNPGSDALVTILCILFGIMFPAWFFSIALEVQVDGQALSYRMFPLQIRWREVPLPDIAAVSLISYRPLREYGGWGIRFGRLGLAYTVSGNRGVVIRLKSGRSFLIGSQRADELEAVLRAMSSPKIP